MTKCIFRIQCGYMGECVGVRTTDFCLNVYTLSEVGRGASNTVG